MPKLEKYVKIKMYSVYVKESIMSEIRNKIITISGEPVSGKSTVVKAITKEYEKQGYTVHKISIGSLFREIAKKEYLKKYPDRVNANIADIQADKDFAENIRLIDEMVDTEVKRRGQEINREERPNDVYIVDSRLAWNQIPEAYSIRLTVNERIAGLRVFRDTTRGSEDQYKTVEEAIEKTRERKQQEIERYKGTYDVDLTNPDNYDLIINTSYSEIDEIADVIIKGEEAYRKEEYYPQNWKSPALFIPSQSIKETLSTSPMGFGMEDVSESIKNQGYNVKAAINVVQQEGVDVLKDGHHRCIAAIAAGKTLIPYEIVSKDDEKTQKYVQGEVRLGDIYDWEDCIRFYAKNERLKDFDIHRDIPIDKLMKREQVSYDNPTDSGR